MQGRCGWIFAYLCNLYGYRDDWAEASRSCVKFIDKYCADPEDRRMYFTVTEDGRPLRKRRYFFSETFSIMAHAEYSLMAGDRGAMEKAREYYDLVVKIYRGEIEDPYRITPKMIAETRACRSLAEPMILMNVSSVMRRCDPENAGKYDALTRVFADDIIKYFYKADKCLVLETVGRKGEFLDHCSMGRLLNPGHDIERAICDVLKCEGKGIPTQTPDTAEGVIHDVRKKDNLYRLEKEKKRLAQMH